MAKRTKEKGRRVWLICGVCLCALLAGLWLSGIYAARLVRLSVKEDCLAPDKPVLVCRVINPTVKSVCYGADFHVERWNEEASAWEPYDVSQWDVNFDLVLRMVHPFGIKTEEYPVWLYGDPYAPGRYHVVQRVSIGSAHRIDGGFHIPTEEEVTLTCEFTIADS